MNCPNCGLAHADTAKFCANCGTFLNSGSGEPPPYQAPTYQAPTYQAPQSAPGRSATAWRNVGLGCLVAIAIFFFFGLSCTRACFRHRRYYRRYAEVVRPVVPRALGTSVLER